MISTWHNWGCYPNHLVRVMFDRFLCCVVIIFLCPYSINGTQITKLSPPSRESGIKLHLWEGVIYIHLNSVKTSSFFCIYYLIIHLYQYDLMNIYFIFWFVIGYNSGYTGYSTGYNPVLCYLFCCSNCSNLVHQESFNIGSCIPWPAPAFGFFCSSHFPCPTRCSRITLYFHYSSPKISHLLKDPWFLL